MYRPALQHSLSCWTGFSLPVNTPQNINTLITGSSVKIYNAAALELLCSKQRYSDWAGHEHRLHDRSSHAAGATITCVSAILHHDAALLCL